MVVIKDGKKYYTTEELNVLLRQDCEKQAKEFARKVIERQKEKKKINQIEYV